MPYHSGNQLVDPHVLFSKAGLQPHMHVADLGCGRTGHLVFPAAKIIGDRGIVYAVDILKEVLEGVGKRARLGGFHNVHTVWADIERVGAIPVPENGLDMVFLVNILFHSSHRHEILEAATRLLKEKARLVIVDWIRYDLPFGPNKENLVDFDDIINWGQSHNFVLQEEFPMGKYHMALVLYKHD